MGAPGQFEVQLGHLCNDRCVFCISGHLTSRGQAPLLEAATILESLDRARAEGHKRVTLLGGEPTIQPIFLEVVRHAAALGFEIVVFTNGSKAGRTDLVDRVAALGAPVEWRFSFQGGDRAAHERTTGRRGSFDQLLRAVARASALGQRITVNTCVVRHNYQSLPALPLALAPFGVAQVHVDMVNPYDTWQYHQHDRAGAATTSLTAESGGTAADARQAIDELQPPYPELVGPLTEMIAGFPEGFDVNIGNLPYCVAPHLAPWIHHGGPPTITTSVDIEAGRVLSRGKEKYLDKQALRTKPDTCRACVFDDRCAGVFAAYAEAHGTEALRPVRPADLDALDTDGRLFALRVQAALRPALAATGDPGAAAPVVEEAGPREVRVRLGGPGGGPGPAVALRPPPGGVAATALFAIHLLEADPLAATEALVARIFRAATAAGLAPLHPPGPDLRPGRVPGPVRAALAALRRAAPFGTLRWRDLRLEGETVEATLVADDGVEVVVWLAAPGGRLRGGYRLSDPARPPSAALVAGIREILEALGRRPGEGPGAGLAGA